MPRQKATTPDLQTWLGEYAQTYSIRKAADAFGLSYHVSRRLYKEAVEKGMLEEPGHAKRGGGRLTSDEIKAKIKKGVPAISGRRDEPATPPAARAGSGVTRFLLTCAQNNTQLYDQFWEHLLGLARHYDARLLIARTVYNRFARASSFDKKLVIDSTITRGPREYWWDKRLTDYFYDERLELAPGLVWVGETNQLPTATNPLAGYESYTGRASMILPHPRIAMRSMQTHPSEGTKLMYTTGTVTQRNYIQRKAGQIAEFHHCYGALLVEVDSEGTWFVRQINADSDATIQDWDVKVEEGHLSTGNSVEGINWGDLHVAYGDPVTYDLAFTPGGMLDELRPRYQFMHDMIDFRARNYHNIYQHRWLQNFKEWLQRHRSVEREMANTAAFLQDATRPGTTETVVVDSNHDNFFMHWLERTGDFRRDPENAVYFLRAAQHLWSVTGYTHGANTPNMTRWAMLDAQPELETKHNVTFLDEDESFIICSDAGGGIECGLHGHERFSGAYGGPAAFAKLGRKMNAGHVHSAGIWDGAYFAGIMGLLDQGYNKGLTNWSQSNIITYPHGKRAIQTIYDAKVRAT